MAVNLKKFRARIGGGGWTTKAFLPRILEAISSCSKVNPNVAIIPVFLEDNDLPCDELEVLLELLGNMLGIENVRSLTDDTQEMPSYNQAKELLEWADVVIIFGGLFPELMARLRQTHIDELLVGAAASGDKIFTGSSSGMIVWFDAAQTNERTAASARRNAKDNEAQFHSTRYHLEIGLGVIPTYVVPHASELSGTTGRSRAGTMERQMRTKPIGKVCISVHTNAALVVDNGLVWVASDDPYSWVQRIERTAKGLKITRHLRGDEPIPVELFFYPTA